MMVSEARESKEEKRGGFVEVCVHCVAFLD